MDPSKNIVSAIYCSNSGKFLEKRGRNNFEGSKTGLRSHGQREGWDMGVQGRALRGNDISYVEDTTEHFRQTR